MHPQAVLSSEEGRVTETTVRWRFVLDSSEVVERELVLDGASEDIFGSTCCFILVIMSIPVLLVLRQQRLKVIQSVALLSCS